MNEKNNRIKKIFRTIIDSIGLLIMIFGSKLLSKETHNQLKIKINDWALKNETMQMRNND